MNDADLKVNYLELICVEAERSMILTRLGYRKSSTILDEKDIRLLDEGIRQGKLLCNPKGAFARIGVLELGQDFISLEKGILLKSKKLRDLLSMSDEVVFMASTVGLDILEAISHEIKNGDAALGLILDSVASETADAGLDWMMSFINKLLVKEAKRLTKYRYSPGYGDLPLFNQKILYDALNLERLGIEITDRFLLVPEKSVLAIAGIERVGIDE